MRDAKAIDALATEECFKRDSKKGLPLSFPSCWTEGFIAGYNRALDDEV